LKACRSIDYLPANAPVQAQHWVNFSNRFYVTLPQASCYFSDAPVSHIRMVRGGSSALLGLGWEIKHPKLITENATPRRRQFLPR